MSLKNLSQKDLWPALVTALFAFLPLLLAVAIFLALSGKALPFISFKSLSTLFFSSTWQPGRGNFGLLPFIAGTIWVTITAFFLAVPVGLLSSIYLSEYAPSGLQKIFRPVLDLLAGLPSVIYGMWGVLLVVPAVRKLQALTVGRESSGYSVLAAGIVLAVMILPTIINVSVEVMSSVPLELKEAALSLGATRLEVVRYVVLKKCFPGIMAACVLGLARAFGETIAVLMVVGNVPEIPRSLFSPAYPLPALLANNYGEMMSIPGYEAALNLAALILLVIVIGFSLIARWYLVKISRRFG
ncbi:MAG: phosphate ABC transporter permease subunit PstC [Candidatus Saccharicenans sp.]|nr:phosphate ABC transporter permease subunit PstC [Candidatus Saccharicenans sp.]